MSDQKQELYQKYAELICTPREWLFAARRLYAAAKLLEPKINKLWKSFDNSIFFSELPQENEPFQASDYQSVYLMLVAYSLENLMKGFWAYKFESELLEEASKNGVLPKMLKTHDLKKLAENCPIGLSDGERALLKKLSSHAEWIGRYPNATTAEKFYNLPSANSTQEWWGSSEVEEIKLLVERITEQLGTSMNPPKVKS